MAMHNISLHPGTYGAGELSHCDMKLPNRPLQNVALVALGVLALQTASLAADFVPERVFAGRSSGQGQLDLVFKEPRPFTVESVGSAQSDGTFRLDQTIGFEGEPTEQRSWVMHQTGPNVYSATLTGAAGPVEAHIEGPRMNLYYPITCWGLAMHQTLELADDGRTVANHGRIKLLGIPVGWLQETIQLEP